MADVESTPKEHFPPLPAATAPLWWAVVIVPAAWAAELQLVYMLAPWACAHDQKLTLHIIDFVALAIAIIGGVVCLRHVLRNRADEGENNRVKWLGMYGALSALMFSTLIIAQTIAGFMLDPCAT